MNQRNRADTECNDLKSVDVSRAPERSSDNQEFATGERNGNGGDPTFLQVVKASRHSCLLRLIERRGWTK
ncbi:hypothetical protein CFAM422_002359 [Trichoderma lentiforme]|uniref:Uncharacterized protein n=1 Tax=Trichoderma lentiforme TaxID=1567552 RepID=A0A9P4XNZ4_9HYPO|nr:hypothetical protein CFAM422_002359 [Trichoderma lentiforme]